MTPNSKKTNDDDLTTTNKKQLLGQKAKKSHLVKPGKDPVKTTVKTMIAKQSKGVARGGTPLGTQKKKQKE